MKITKTTKTKIQFDVNSKSFIFNKKTKIITFGYINIFSFPISNTEDEDELRVKLMQYLRLEKLRRITDEDN